MVFEGFIDFLSYLALKSVEVCPCDVIVLNSNTNKEKADLSQYSTIYLTLDNDTSGKETAKYLMAKYPDAVDLSDRYAKHKDLNEFLTAQKLAV